MLKWHSNVQIMWPVVHASRLQNLKIITLYVTFSLNVIYYMIYIWILLYVAFCTIMAISRQKEARSRDYALHLFRMTSMVLYSAQYHRQHCKLHAFEQFGALYMHNHDDKYPSRPGFEPGTLRLQAPVDTNEPSDEPYTSCARPKLYPDGIARFWLPWTLIYRIRIYIY